MANPKVTTVLNFATSGASGVTNATGAMTRGVESTTSAVDRLHSRLKSIQAATAFTATVQAVSAVKSAITGAIDAIGGFASGVYGVAESQAKMADVVGKTARTLGLQALDFQALRSAGQHAGLSIDQVDTALEKFSVSMARAANGEKTQLQMFNALGVRTKDSSGRMRNMASVMMDVADAYSMLTNEQDKNRISTELFGRNQQLVSLLLSEGRSGIEKSIAAFRSTGAGFSEDDVKSAAAFNDTFQEMREIVSGIKKDLFFALVPAFTKLSSGVSSFVSENRPQINEIVDKLSTKLPKVVDGVTSALPSILSVATGIASAVASILEFTGPWVPLLTSAAVILGGSIATAVVAISTAVAAVGPVLMGTVLPAIGAVAVAAAPVVGTVIAIGAGIASVASIVMQVYDNWAMLKSFVVDDCFPAFISGVKSFANAAISEVQSVLSIFGKIPFAGKIFSSAASLLDGAKFSDVGFSDVSSKDIASGFDAVPPGQSSASAVTGANYSSSLTVDFRGVPRGTTITPASNFGQTNFDYSAGYAFGG